MRRLLVMRHAKSDWAVGAADHQRPLNARGRRAAAAMGRLLAEVGEAPELALCSTAERARTTLDLAVDAGGWATRVEHTDDLYATDVDSALRTAAGADDGAMSLMLVGHEPTWSGLVGRLTGGAVAVKTGTVVGIDLFAGSWDELPGARGEIAYVLQPRLFDRD